MASISLTRSCWFGYKTKSNATWTPAFAWKPSQLMARVPRVTFPSGWKSGRTFSFGGPCPLDVKCGKGVQQRKVFENGKRFGP